MRRMILRGRDAVDGLRLRAWAQVVGLRLRSRGATFSLRLDGPVRCRRLPVVRLAGGGRGGRIALRLGGGVDLGTDLHLDLDPGVDGELVLGARTELEHAVRIQLLGGRILVGDGSVLRDGVTLKVTAPEAQLRLGVDSRIGRHVAIHCEASVTIDDLVVVAERATVIDSFHDVDGSDTWTMAQPTGRAPVRVGRNVLVLAGAVVLHGSTIGANCVVGVNAVVSGDHAPGGVLVGSPARRVRELGPARA